MLFGSICSGIEAASVAWNHLGWKAVWLSEIEQFPSEVLRQRFPDVPNLGDMTKLPEMILREEIEAPDLLCGGTPCQAFSVAGLRKSLDDDRGNLSLIFCEIANAVESVRKRNHQPPPIIFWENVPGVLRTKDNAFGCFVGALAGADFPFDVPSGRWESSGRISGADRKLAWRTLDAQYFGVPQRRKRVFVVASSREDFDPSKILFEPSGMSGVTDESAEKREEATYGFNGSSSERPDETVIYDIAHACDVVRTYKDVSPSLIARMGTGGGSVPLVVMDQGGEVITFEHDKTGTLRAQSKGHEPLVIHESAVRKLTPIECERLQGFPDNWTRIPYRGRAEEDCPDSPRYKAIGNSWAVPVARWIGERIQRELSENFHAQENYEKSSS